MELLSTSEIAEHMLSTGKTYCISSLYKELDMPISLVSGKFHNIRMAKKYETIVVSTNPIMIKVIDISGRAKEKSLWKIVLQSNI